MESYFSEEKVGLECTWSGCTYIYNRVRLLHSIPQVPEHYSGSQELVADVINVGRLRMRNERLEMNQK